MDHCLNAGASMTHDDMNTGCRVVSAAHEWPSSPTLAGQKRHDIILQGLKILKNLDHRGAVGPTRAGRRRRHPGPDPRRAYPRRRAAHGAGRPRPRAGIERAIAAEGQVPSRLARRADPQRGCRHGQEVEPVIRQVFVGRGSRDMDQDALERKLYVIRKRSPTRPGAGVAPRQGVLRAVVLDAHALYKGMLLADQVGSFTWISPTRRWCRRWRWSTSASRPTRSRPGTSRIRSASSPQRRDQHAARQLQLDGAREGAILDGARRRPEKLFR